MDPNGNITIKWDFLASADNGAPMVTVTIYNNQLYRHLEPPGWRLSWTWANNEFIYTMLGAEATEQGNCSRLKEHNPPPHSCSKTPVIVDLSVGTSFNKQSANCCKDGVLTSLVQDPGKSLSSFQMTIGKNGNDENNNKPGNFSIGVAGYSCGEMEDVEATRFKVSKKRTIQALSTWQVICTYSQFRESSLQSCCVSLSAFYSETIVSCPKCSCGCEPSITDSKCLRDGERIPDSLQLPDYNDQDGSMNNLVRCTNHMCPIRVHWHIKTSYKGYWRIKITVTNFNVGKNYSDWNLVVQHPDLYNITHIYSFQYKPLLQYGNINNTGVFWGIETYNNMLLQDGNVQTEIVLAKDPDFTFGHGFGFPRRISFNGHDCVLPSPDEYPTLPNMSPRMVVLSPVWLSFVVLLVVLGDGV